MIKGERDLFKILNIDKNYLTKKQKFFLNKNGYLLFEPPKVIKNSLEKLNNISEKILLKEGSKGGWEGKEKYYKKGKFFEEGALRLGNLLNKHMVFGKLILIPEILACAKEVIKKDIKIGGIDLRTPLKNKGFQKIHIDWLPRKNRTERYKGVVCFIFLDDVKKDNGPLRLIPGSHKFVGWPDKKINVYKAQKNEKKIIAKAGSICIMNLNLWHGGTNNISGKRRKAILIDIRARKEPQLLNFKKYLNKKVKNSLSDAQKYLLAVRKVDKDQKMNSFGPGDTYRKEIKVSN